MSPDDVITQLCINPKPIPFNAGQVADVAGCTVEEAQRACDGAARAGICLETRDAPPEGRGTHTYVGVRSKAMPWAKKRNEERARRDAS